MIYFKQFHKKKISYDIKVKHEMDSTVVHANILVYGGGGLSSRIFVEQVGGVGHPIRI